MANCIQTITFGTMANNPVSGNPVNALTMDQLTNPAANVIGPNDAGQMQAALAALMPGSSGSDFHITFRGDASGITDDYYVDIEFAGSLAGYDWINLVVDSSTWMDALGGSVGNSVAVTQNGTIDYHTLYWFDSGGHPWESLYWYRDVARTIPASGYPGSESGSYSVYITDSPGANTCPVAPLSGVTLALFDTTAVTATDYAAGSNLNLADGGTMVLGAPSNAHGTTFTGTVGDGCTVTLQGASVLSAGSFGASTVTCNDHSCVTGTTFATNGAIINFNSNVFNYSVGTSTFNGITTINAYQTMNLFGNTYTVAVTVNVMVSGTPILAEPNLTIVADVGTIPAAADVRSGTAVGNGTGTLVVPAANKVQVGTVFDNGTVGTYAGGATPPPLGPLSTRRGYRL